MAGKQPIILKKELWGESEGNGKRFSSWELEVGKAPLMFLAEVEENYFGDDHLKPLSGKLEAQDSEV